MRCLLLVLLLGSLVLAQGDVLQRLDDYWDGRENPQSVQDGLAFSTQVVLNSPSAEIYWRQARLYYWMGEKVASSRDSRLEFFNKGLESAEKAVALDSNCADSYYWLASLTGKVGETRGILQSLFMVKPMHTALERALAIDEAYASAHYVLGILYRKVPRWPVSIGDMNKSLEHAQRAVELDPEDLEFRLGLAEVYLDRKEKAKARPILEEILRSPDKPGSVPESQASKKIARELLAGL